MTKVKVNDEKKYVQPEDWKLYVSLLIIVWGMVVLNALDNLTSAVLIILAAFLFLFKKYVIEKKEKICFLNDKFSFEDHENRIDSINKERWINIFIFAFAIMILRVVDTVGYINFGSNLATLILFFALLYNFRIEINEYRSHFANINIIKTYEEMECDLLNSLFSSRAVFSAIISGISLLYLSIEGVLNPMYSALIYMCAVALICCAYWLLKNNSFEDEFANTIPNSSSYNTRRRTCSYQARPI
jgi:hypothetical protein